MLWWHGLFLFIYLFSFVSFFWYVPATRIKLKSDIWALNGFALKKISGKKKSFLTADTFLQSLFFLSGFSFTDNDDLKDSRGREGAIFYSTLYYFHLLTNMQIFICNFAEFLLKFFPPPFWKDGCMLWRYQVSRLPNK